MYCREPQGSVCWTVNRDSGRNRVGMSPKDAEKTAFSIQGGGLWKYKETDPKKLKQLRYGLFQEI